MQSLLYIEDHPPARFLMQAIIGDLTVYQLLLAGSGDEALSIVRRGCPTLCIIDLDLPDTDGISLARAIRLICPCPLVLISAYAEAVSAKLYEDIVFAYLAKPLDPDLVVATVQRALAGS